jgi:hypothetical protein
MAKNDSMISLKTDAIRARIFTIRGQQVMLDKDIATLYEVKPRRLREQVQRNIERFPEDFMFQLTDSEVDFMVSQNAIPSRQHLGGSLPYVFTEQGVSLKDLGKKWFAFSKMNSMASDVLKRLEGSE